MFLELPDFQITVHWLGIPYIVESSFRGYFIFVTDIFENELTDYELMDNILKKFKLLQKNKLIANTPTSASVFRWPDVERYFFLIFIYENHIQFKT